MFATVFYVTLTDEQINDLNSKGWSSGIGLAYMDAKAGKVTEQNVGLFVQAAECDWFTDAEHAWTSLQNLDQPWSKREDIRCVTGFPRSMDVGDLIVWADGRIERCAVAGFEPYTGPTPTWNRARS